MAGSYNHCVDDEGRLHNPTRLNEEMLLKGKDVYEAVEEMYGMIWYLADLLRIESNNPSYSAADVVEQARQHWAQGIEEDSPGREPDHIRGVEW